MTNAPVPPRREWTGKRIPDKKGVLRPPAGKWNESRRPRGEHLTLEEVEALCAAAGRVGRHRHRDSTLIWVGFVHGLRVSELAALRIEQYDLKASRLTVTRVKNGRTSIHTVEPREKKAIKERIGNRRAGPVFLGERKDGGPLSSSAILKIITRAGQRALDIYGSPLINFPAHPHMLRHACGYHLNDLGLPIRHIQEWLGHKNIRHTERYAAMSPRAFEAFRFDGRPAQAHS